MVRCRTFQLRFNRDEATVWGGKGCGLLWRYKAAHPDDPMPKGWVDPTSPSCRAVQQKGGLCGGFGIIFSRAALLKLEPTFEDQVKTLLPNMQVDMGVSCLAYNNGLDIQLAGDIIERHIRVNIGATGSLQSMLPSDREVKRILHFHLSALRGAGFRVGEIMRLVDSKKRETEICDSRSIYEAESDGCEVLCGDSARTPSDEQRANFGLTPS